MKKRLNNVKEYEVEGMRRYEKRCNKIKVEAWLEKLLAHLQKQRHSLDTTKLRLRPRYSSIPVPSP